MELEGLRGRLVLHFAEADQFCPAPAREAILAALAERPGTEGYVYTGVDHAFARPAGHHYDKPAALLAYERTIAALRRTLGPDYNLSALWEEHIRHEFATRDVRATTATMVPEPYVNFRRLRPDRSLALSGLQGGAQATDPLHGPGPGAGRYQRQLGVAGLDLIAGDRRGRRR